MSSKLTRNERLTAVDQIYVDWSTIRLT